MQRVKKSENQSGKETKYRKLSPFRFCDESFNLRKILFSKSTRDWQWRNTIHHVRFTKRTDGVSDRKWTRFKNGKATQLSPKVYNHKYIVMYLWTRLSVRFIPKHSVVAYHRRENKTDNENTDYRERRYEASRCLSITSVKKFEGMGDQIKSHEVLSRNLLSAVPSVNHAGLRSPRTSHLNK